ncbi:hypothetical protein Tco_0510602 [Tanacetum coccineum]
MQKGFLSLGGGGGNHKKKDGRQAEIGSSAVHVIDAPTTSTCESEVTPSLNNLLLVRLRCDGFTHMLSTNATPMCKSSEVTDRTSNTTVGPDVVKNPIQCEMAHSENNTLSSAFKTFFERETLTGPNFNDWYRSLRIVLRVADTFDYLYKPCPEQPVDSATEAEKAAFRAEYKKHFDVACIMLGKMSPALQRQFENYPPQNMLARVV